MTLEQGVLRLRQPRCDPLKMDYDLSGVVLLCILISAERPRAILKGSYQ